MRDVRRHIFGKYRTLFGIQLRDLILLFFMLLTQTTLHLSLWRITEGHFSSVVGQGAYYIAEGCFLAVDLYLIRWILTQNRRRRDEEELLQVRYEMEQERIRYEELNERREYIARIRHDYNNQLDTIKYLMKKDPQEAQRMTESLLQVVREEEGKMTGGEADDRSDL